MKYHELFDSLHPGFFLQESIRDLPEEFVFTELVMDLRGSLPCTVPLPCPENIAFGEYHGSHEKLLDAVRLVNGDWVRYFREGNRFFCACDGEMPVSFCILDNMGQWENLHIGGPGCVGTVPEYRNRGIGLELVRQATLALKADGYDLSWIHFTHLEGWYRKLGYMPVLKWNCRGFLP